MFTRTREVEDDETFGLKDETEGTVIEVYLEPFDLEFLKQNDCLMVPDPTVSNGIMVGSPTGGMRISVEGDVTAAFGMSWRSHGKRIESGRTPLVYATAHQDGRGDSTKGTFVLFYHAVEADE